MLERQSGIIILLCLLPFCLMQTSIQASTNVTIKKIQQMGLNTQGDVQKRFKNWEKLIDSLQGKSVDVQLEKVNTFFNQFSYQSDMDSKGIEDYWKSPDEFIKDGGGDCEDYAIIKYFTLVALGIPSEKLRITYVSSLTLNQAHMVLSYYASPEAEPLILDNLENKILKASQRPDLKPVYSFNSEGLWLAKQRSQSIFPNNLIQWDALIKRMEKQGEKP